MTVDEKSGKTNNEKVAEYMSKVSGIPMANCTNCLFWQRHPNKEFRGQCTHAVAIAAKAIATHEAATHIPLPLPEPQYPMFPIVTFSHEEDGVKKDDRVPSVIANEYGLQMGLVKWPVEYDPIYILFCFLYMTLEAYNELQKHESSGQ